MICHWEHQQYACLQPGYVIFSVSYHFCVACCLYFVFSWVCTSAVLTLLCTVMVLLCIFFCESMVYFY